MKQAMIMLTALTVLTVCSCSSKTMYVFTMMKMTGLYIR